MSLAAESPSLMSDGGDELLVDVSPDVIPPLIVPTPFDVAAQAEENAGVAADSSSLPIHPQMKRIFLYLFVHASTLGILSITIPVLLLRIYDDNHSSAAYTSSLAAALTAGIGFFVYPIIGMLSDFYGRRPAIILSLSGSAVAFLLLGVFSNLGAYFAAAVVRGLTDVSYTISWAVLGDVTPRQHFIGVYGRLQAAAGVGIVLGPLIALGCELVERYHFAFLLSAALESANLIFILRTFRETLFFFDRAEAREAASAAEANLPRPPPIVRESFATMYARRTLNPFKSLLILRSTPALWCLALALFFQYVGYTGTLSVFFLYTSKRFGWGSVTNGIYVFSIGAASIIANALLLPYLSKRRRVPERRLLLLSMGSSIAQQVVWALAPSDSGWLLFVASALLMSAFFLTSLIRAIISRQIEPNKQGELQGALTCLVTLASVIGPLALNGVFGLFSSDHAPVYFPGAPFVLNFVLESLVASLLYYVTRYHLPREHTSAYTSLADPHGGAMSVELVDRTGTSSDARSDTMKDEEEVMDESTSSADATRHTHDDEEYVCAPTNTGTAAGGYGKLTDQEDTE